MKTVIKVFLISSAFLLVVYGFYAISEKGSESKSALNVTPSVQTKDILKVQDGDNIKGSKTASITIIGYSDYQCPYCIKYDNTLNEVISAYPTQVKWIYRHFPLPFHQAAKEASIAAEAAGAQGKYWEFHDKIVANSQANGKGLQGSDLIKYATELSLNLDQFKKDLKNPKIVSKVESDTASGNALKIQGTPASYLIDGNGKVEQLKGALTLGQLKTKIDAALTK